jgi:4-aminobutyrate aminotransferase-like enzyme/Ser/Thr protein kinase RdoA (MazF antagonist)
MPVDFALQKPGAEPGEGNILAVLRGAFDVDGRLTRLDGECDLNWRVDAGHNSYVAKACPEPADDGLFRFQEALLGHIHQLEPGIRVPSVVTTTNGDSTARFAVDGNNWCLRLFTFVPGRPLRAMARTPALLRELGRFMGRLSRTMQGFGHPAAHRPGYLWDLDNAARCRESLAYIEPAGTRALVARTLDRWERRVQPLLPGLPASVVHHDANDDNLLVTLEGETMQVGLIDFGDAIFTRRINELAVTLAYVLMDVDDVPQAARSVIRGYTETFPLTREELSVVVDLAAARLAMSLSIASRREAGNTGNDYLQVSRGQAESLLGKLDAMNPAFAACLALAAGGHPPVAAGEAVASWLSSNTHQFESVFPFDLNTAPRMLVTLQEDSPGRAYAQDHAAWDQWLRGSMMESGARFAVGLYGEQRECYTTDQFRNPAGGESRSVHLGIDLFVPAGTPVRAPLAGRVASIQDNDAPLDYGPTIILEHRCGRDGPAFWTLYGHLSRRCLGTLKAGDAVEAGQSIAEIGMQSENGGWSPHLHFQVMTDLLGEHGNFHGAGEPGNMDVWRAICPDPNLVLGLAPGTFDRHTPPPEALTEKRARLLGPSLSLSYRHKLHITRGRGAWLYDHTGRAYLDCVNNICHVGHCHPRVVEALHAQAARLNTNTRYLNERLLDYAERLLVTFPDPLSVCYFVCSGSEANELALRLARNHTGRRDLVVLDWAYHGNTGGLIDISPYKFNRSGGSGKPDHVEIAELPDPYRGPHKGYAESTAIEYARAVESCIESCRSRTGQGPAAMIAESIPGCGGQIVFPDRYLRHAFERIRSAGGVCIADEVQTGFGRVGERMWAFELQEVVPDIVTLGKPIGNGHPMAAVITTREIAEGFANGMEYFNSFGGNPVSAAVGLSVLDVMTDERLQEKALRTGEHLIRRLEGLARKHEVIGDVRGKGLFIGVELVNDRRTLEPATETAGNVINMLREEGILLSTDGPYDNVLKIKPPLAFGEREADLLCSKLDECLANQS